MHSRSFKCKVEPKPLNNGISKRIVIFKFREDIHACVPIYGINIS